MYYYRVMGYDMHFPANQLGGPKKGMDYKRVWVKAEMTVFQIFRLHEKWE